MIDDIELKKILKDYNLTFSRQTRNKLKDNLDYNELKEVLSLLRRLNISQDLIEKYPNILYFNNKDIINTLSILKNNDLYNYTQEELMKILSTSNDRIRGIYHYLSNKYDKELINNNILILSVPIDRIKRMEKFEMLISQESLMAATLSNFSEEEIQNIILTCSKLNINITPYIFRRNSTEIRDIIKYCNENNQKANDIIFTKSPSELKKCEKFFSSIGYVFNSELITCPMSSIERLIESIEEKKDVIYDIKPNKVRELFNIYERFNFNIDIDLLTYNPDHVKDILKACSRNNIFMTETMLKRTPEELEEIIKYCKDRGIKIRDCYFNRTKNELEEISRKFNPSLKREDSLYKHTYEEIVKILRYCADNEIKFENTIFNQDISEIEKIINTCNKRHIPVSNGVYKVNARNLDRIVSILKQQPLVIPYTDIAFNRTPNEVYRIKEIIRDNNLPIMNELFLKTPYEIEEMLKLLKGKPLEKEYFKVSLSKFKEIINFCEENNIKISPSMVYRTIGELEDIIEKCKYRNIEIIDPVYQRKPDEMDEIIDYCEQNDVLISGDCFRKNPEQFKEAVDVCKKLGIPAEGEVFKREPEEIRKINKIYDKLLNKNPVNNSFSTTPEEVEKIISLLLDKNIEISGPVFRRKEKELKDTIEFIENKYGKEYLLPQIIIYDKEHVNCVFAYLGGRGKLDIIKSNSIILKLSLAEIIEREAYINETGGKLIEEDKFNPVISWSKKKFQEANEIMLAKKEEERKKKEESKRI